MSAWQIMAAYAAIIFDLNKILFNKNQGGESVLGELGAHVKKLAIDELLYMSFYCFNC